MMSDPWQECLDFCVEVTKQAGQVIRDALQKDITIMEKSSPVDLVTETDQRVEQLIISSIREQYPSHSFIGEESVSAGAPSVLTDDPTWIIDPIDGTTNFVHRFPFVAVSIGFTVKKVIEFGIVYSCVEDKMYTARKGKGAFCNGLPIKVSGQQDIKKSLVLTETNFKADAEQFNTMLANVRSFLTIPVHGVRSPGSAAVNMCLVACGSADAYYHMGIHCWDMAGGAAVLTEAGGVIMDISGGPFDLMSRRLIVASSRAIAERLVKEIKPIRGTGTAATNMCMVACGAVEAFFEIGIHCWDVAAGVVIVQEAGGVVLDVNGGPFDLMSRRMLCANHADIANRVIKEIESFPSKRDDVQ